MKKRILIIANAYSFLYKFERENVALLQRMGYEVHYAANLKEQCYEEQKRIVERLGVCLHHLPLARSPYLYRQNKEAFDVLLSLIRCHSIEVLHCHTPVAAVLARLASRFVKRPLYIIYTAHGFHFYRGAPLLNNTLYYLVERQLAKETDVLITINEEDHAQAKKLRLKPGGRVYLIPGVGLDIARFHPLSPITILRQRQSMGFLSEDFVAVSVGELNGNKNQEALLDVFVKLRAMGACMAHMHCLILGDGVYEARLRRQIRERALQDSVHLLGHVHDVRMILGSSDAFLFPSKREGLGMAALEALSMGIPVIAADNRGPREYMQDGENGFVCEPEVLPVQMAQGILRLQQMRLLEKERLRQRCMLSVRMYEKRYPRRIMQEIYTRMDAQVYGS